MSPKLFIVIGALSAALAVAFGAFGAHALRGALDERARAVYQTAVDYHFIHALALLLVGVLLQLGAAPTAARGSGILFIVGTLLFSGSLYALAVSGTKWLGMITPFGGLAFIAGWLWLGWTVFKSA
ncbi:MAG: DUF423 domain-containing protein [Thiotrichales bacterium]